MEIQLTLNNSCCSRRVLQGRASNPSNLSETRKFILRFHSIIKPSAPFPLTKSHASQPHSSNLLKNSPRRKKLHAETTGNRRVESLIRKLNENDSKSPLQLLRDDGDWSKDQFWAVIKFLKQRSRFDEIPQVFNMWKNLAESRNNEFNYTKFISLLSEVGLLEEAASALQEMKNLGLELSSDIYNSVIHGYANKGRFYDALLYLKEMEEINFRPDTQTYDGLIEAYGKFKMYDEMIECVKMMECCRLTPDHVTYNLLIRELSRGGLINRMERMYQTLISKKMYIQSSTLVSMLEAYADFGVLEKMEKVYRKIINSKTMLKEEIIRKLAGVYIQNFMFFRLDELGNDLSLRVGRTELFWCLRLLSHACLLSKKGMDSILEEMEEAEVPWNATVANIILLACLKMHDLKRLKVILSQLKARCVEPDVITFGIVFDAKCIGLDWRGTLEIWKQMRYLDGFVEINTDPIVLTAFGKGGFLRILEEKYSFLEPQARGKPWTYSKLIEFVLKMTDDATN
ncbi:hypothetical protein Ancab_014012 [Ancistrocladus abbreviatus]